jgi:exopolysaccharide biosynthesis WecB/TagA/CpsF family protein
MNGSGAGFVFLGIGSPRQEHFAWEQKHDIAAVQLCVGAAYDFVAGTKRRAPEWMQQRGLEWLHRFYKEPVRLGNRYLCGNIKFLKLLVPQLLASFGLGVFKRRATERSLWTS